MKQITSSKSFTQLTAGLSEAAVCSTGPVGADVPILGVTADSRQVQNGFAFVAVRGFVHDGHAFIGDAIRAGAPAIVYQDSAFDDAVPNAVARLRVSDTRRALAIIADRFYDHPSGELKLVGVTGTNGKTTTVAVLDSVFRAAGCKTGTIGTLGATVLDSHIPGDRTTPDAVGLQSLLADMVRSSVTHAAMEVTSHALDLCRVYQTAFAAGVFCNLSQDHLDWHHTMDSYFASKAAFFTDYVDFSPDMVAAINLDDPYGARMAEVARCEVTGYAIESAADVRASDVQLSPTGTVFMLQLPGHSLPVHSALVGRFNVYNCLAAAAAAYALGFDPEAIASGLTSVTGADGRFERVDVGQPFTVLVDYAHTPEALQNVLEAARSLRPQRLICVFGCGGDRDRTKRPRMGEVTTKLADLTVITSDNPRSEDPDAIIADIIRGTLAGKFRVEADRRAAIALAIAEAQAEDLVLIAGKGHETYQEFADGRIDFDDRLVAAAVLREQGYGRDSTDSKVRES